MQHDTRIRSFFLQVLSLDRTVYYVIHINFIIKFTYVNTYLKQFEYNSCRLYIKEDGFFNDGFSYFTLRTVRYRNSNLFKYIISFAV